MFISMKRSILFSLSRLLYHSDGLMFRSLYINKLCRWTQSANKGSISFTVLIRADKYVLYEVKLF